LLRISIIIPVLNEEGSIETTLLPLQPMRSRGHEIIVVDGGSDDKTILLASALADRVLQVPKSRGGQMRRGAAESRNEVLWFLHGDTVTEPDADRSILEGLTAGHYGWGRFDVRLSGAHPLLRVVERCMNIRSRLSSIATGDQGIFVTRKFYDAVGGIPEIPIMEDIAFSRSLKKLGKPLCLKIPLKSSSRRWESQGMLKTILRMWRLRFAYACGADPRNLVRLYEES
jgi:rSAM/selenodomain-associated transferase 2